MATAPSSGHGLARKRQHLWPVACIPRDACWLILCVQLRGRHVPRARQIQVPTRQRASGFAVAIDGSGGVGAGCASSGSAGHLPKRTRAAAEKAECRPGHLASSQTHGQCNTCPAWLWPFPVKPVPPPLALHMLQLRYHRGLWVGHPCIVPSNPPPFLVRLSRSSLDKSAQSAPKAAVSCTQPTPSLATAPLAPPRVRAIHRRWRALQPESRRAQRAATQPRRRRNQLAEQASLQQAHPHRMGCRCCSCCWPPWAWWLPWWYRCS